MDRPTDTLQDWIAGELGRPVDPTARAISDHLRAEFGGSVAAVLFYGSCLREPDFDDKIADFYVLVDSYRTFHGTSLMAVLNRLIPPNVYFRTFTIDGVHAKAKVAVLSLEAFERRASPRALLASIWGRFCQPSRLVFARDDATAQRVAAAVTQAVSTFSARTAPLVGNGAAPDTFWIRGLMESYRTELRAERLDRCRALYQADRPYYDTLHTRLNTQPQGSPWSAQVGWICRRIAGKVYSVMRLIKAAFTFNGGADYLCWKITRHSGVDITLTPWQRRHPILASTVLFWTLYRKGAFR